MEVENGDDDAIDSAERGESKTESRSFERVEDGKVVPAWGGIVPLRSEFEASVTNSTPVHPWVRCQCGATLVWRRRRSSESDPFACCSSCKFGPGGKVIGGCLFRSNFGPVFAALVKWHTQGPTLSAQGTSYLTVEPHNEKQATMEMKARSLREQYRAATVVDVSATTVASGKSSSRRQVPQISGQQVLKKILTSDDTEELGGFGPPVLPNAQQRQTRGFAPRKCGCCSHVKVYTSKQGLSEHRKKCLAFQTTFPAQAAELLRTKKRGRRSTREKFFGSGACDVRFIEPSAPTTDVLRVVAQRQGQKELPTVDELQKALRQTVASDIKNGNFRSWDSIVRRPPHPVLQARGAERAAGATPSMWAVRGVCFWDPESYWKTPKPTCCCGRELAYDGWTEPTLVVGVHDCYELVGRRLRCCDCEKKHKLDKVTQYNFKNTDERFLQQLVTNGFDWVVMEFPCVVYPRFALDKRVIPLLRRGAVVESLSGIKSLVNELHATDYYERYERYAAYEDWDRKNADPLHARSLPDGEDVRRRPFLEMPPRTHNTSSSMPDGYRDYVPSQNGFRRAFLREVARIADFIRKRMLMLHGRILRGDATFNTAKKMRDLEQVLKSLYTIMDEFGCVEDQAPIFNDGEGSELQSSTVSAMCRNLRARYKTAPFDFWYTDNCCNEAAQLMSAFDWLSAYYANLAGDDLTFNGKTHYATTIDESGGVRAVRERRRRRFRY